MKNYVFSSIAQSLSVAVFALILLLGVGSQMVYGQVYITGVNPVETPDDAGCFVVPFQTTFEDAVKVLPTTATITLSDDSEMSVPLTGWSPTNLYFSYCFGDHEVVGTFELPEGIGQADPAIPLQVKTVIRMTTGRDLLSVNWEGFNQPGTYSEEHMVVNNEDRVFYTYVPSTHDASKPMPLVIDIHGGYSNGLAQWTSSRCDRYAEKEGFICVAPNYFEIPMPKDVDFISEIIDEMKVRYNIDDRRVYAWGPSGGGVLTTYLAYKLADKIAGVGIVVATIPTGILENMRVMGIKAINLSTCINHRVARGNYPPRPMPIVLIAGSREFPVTGEEIYQGERGVPVTSDEWWNSVDEMMPTAEALAKHFHCNSEPEITEFPATELDLDNLPYWTSEEDARAIAERYPTSGTRYTWSGGDEGIEITAYALWDFGHLWPGGTQSFAFEDYDIQTYVIDATEQLWGHLSKYSLPKKHGGCGE